MFQLCHSRVFMCGYDGFGSTVAVLAVVVVFVVAVVVDAYCVMQCQHYVSRPLRHLITMCHLVLMIFQQKSTL